MTTQTRKRNRRKTNRPPSLIRSVSIALAISALIAIIILVITSVIVYNTPDPLGATKPGGLAVLYISAFAGGLAAALLYRDAPLLAGVTQGAALFTAITLLSLILPGTSREQNIMLSIGLHLIAVVFSFLGA